MSKKLFQGHRFECLSNSIAKSHFSGWNFQLLYWIGVVRMDNLILFLILGEQVDNFNKDMQTLNQSNGNTRYKKMTVSVFIFEYISCGCFIYTHHLSGCMYISFLRAFSMCWCWILLNSFFSLNIWKWSCIFFYFVCWYAELHWPIFECWISLAFL